MARMQVIASLQKDVASIYVRENPERFEQFPVHPSVKPLERHPVVRGAAQFIVRRSNEPSGAALAIRIGISRRRFVQVFSGAIDSRPSCSAEFIASKK